MSGKNLDSLIGNLTEELEPTKPMAHPFIRMMPWCALVLVYVYLVVEYVGVRHDLGAKLTDPRFIFEISIISFVGITALISSNYLCVPDMRGRSWMIALPFTGLGLFSIWSVIHAIMIEGEHMPQLHIDHCMGEGAFMAVIPLAMLLFMMRKGATTRPLLMASMNVLTVISISYIGLRMTCAMDSVGHTVVGHLLPYIGIGLVLGLAARKLYKW